MNFEIISDIMNIENIAIGNSIREINRLRKYYGNGRWRKMKTKFIVCINNDGYETSLEKRKLYQVIEDSKAELLNLVRVVDERGEDYLYPANYFLEIKLNKEIEDAILID